MSKPVLVFIKGHISFEVCPCFAIFVFGYRNGNSVMRSVVHP